MKWIEEKTCRTRWTPVRHLGSGGQGTTTLMTRIDFPLIESCVKQMKGGKKDPGRRARIFREATAYDTCQHAGIPELVESNAHLHDDMTADLYIATQFIPGRTMGDHIEQGGPLPLDTAVDVTVRLLDTLEYLHDQNWVHRDIKPDNIIFRDGDPMSPVLVDFGIAFKDDVIDVALTQAGEELGNRFLRIPELAPSGMSKQDPRSDVTLACGVLLFLLTGSAPGTVVDGGGQMPHQRPSFSTILPALSGTKLHRLLGILDRGFALRVDLRYQTAAELKKDLQRLLSPAELAPSAADIEFIEDYARRPTTAVSLAETRAIAAARGALNMEQGKFSKLLPGYSRSHSETESATGRKTLEFRAQLTDRPSLFARLRFDVYAAGPQLVVGHMGRSIYRTNITDPEFTTQEFTEAVSPLFAGMYRTLIENPLSSVATRGYFDGGVFSSMSHALAAASDLKQPLVAVVFDKDHSELSRIDYILGNYLKYETTRRIFADGFVTAIVPASDPDIGAYLAAGPLESVRWIVLDRAGVLVEALGISGNPDDGLQHAQRLELRFAAK